MSNAIATPKHTAALPYERFARWILMFLPVVLGLVYFAMACTTPMEFCPDEEMRYDIPLFIFNHGELPNGWDPEIRNPIWGTSYAFNVYGSSLLAAVLMRICSLFTIDPSALLVAARLSSVLFSVGTLYFCAGICKRIFKQSPWSQILLVVLVGMLPQFAFISSYLNCDAMNIFCSAFIIYELVRGIQSQWRLRDVILLGIALGLCALSYYNAYGMVIVSIVVYYASCIANPQRRKIKYLLGYPILIMLISLLVCGWFFIRNAVLYEGDFLGMKSSSLASEMFAEDGIKPSQRTTPKNMGGSLLSLFTAEYFGMHWIISTAKSFVGMFGYMNIFMPWVLYWAYAFIIVMGFILFWVKYFMRRAYRDKKRNILLVGLLLSMAIPFALSLYYSWASDFQAQGRYLFSGLIGLMILVADGWNFGSSCFEVDRTVDTSLTRQEKPWGAVVISTIWTICFIIVFVRVFIPECLLGISIS